MMENSDTSSDRWTTTEALKTLFLSLAPDAEGRVSGTKIRAWVATRYAEALDTASLVDSWDEADTTKRGSLDEAEFLVFAAALGSAASLDCLEAGFTASLRCSSCAKLESLVPDPELAADCGACCSEDLSASASYASAILEVCE